jgi:hypothetical protein
MPETPRPQRVAHVQEGQSLDNARGGSAAIPGPSGQAVESETQPFSQEQINALARLLGQSVQNAGGPPQALEGSFDRETFRGRLRLADPIGT